MSSVGCYWSYVKITIKINCQLKFCCYHWETSVTTNWMNSQQLLPSWIRQQATIYLECGLHSKHNLNFCPEHIKDVWMKFLLMIHKLSWQIELQMPSQGVTLRPSIMTYLWNSENGNLVATLVHITIIILLAVIPRFATVCHTLFPHFLRPASSTRVCPYRLTMIPSVALSFPGLIPSPYSS